MQFFKGATDNSGRRPIIIQCVPHFMWSLPSERTQHKHGSSILNHFLMGIKGHSTGYVGVLVGCMHLPCNGLYLTVGLLAPFRCFRPLPALTLGTDVFLLEGRMWELLVCGLQGIQNPSSHC